MFEAASQPGECQQSNEEQLARIDEAERRMEASRAKFSKLRSTCIGALQVLLPSAASLQAHASQHGVTSNLLCAQLS